MTLLEIISDKEDLVLNDIYGYGVYYRRDNGWILRNAQSIPKLDVFIDDFHTMLYFDAGCVDEWPCIDCKTEIDEVKHVEECIKHTYYVVKFERYMYYFFKWKGKTYDKLVNCIRDFLSRCTNYLE